MIECVCVVRCQTRNKHGKAQRYNPGEVDSFEECPKHFKPIAGEEAAVLDFDTASEEHLKAAEFELSELKDYIKTKYDQSAGNRGKDKTIEFLMDCRERASDVLV